MIRSQVGRRWLRDSRRTSASGTAVLIHAASPAMCGLASRGAGLAAGARFAAARIPAVAGVSGAGGAGAGATAVVGGAI